MTHSSAVPATANALLLGALLVLAPGAAHAVDGGERLKLLLGAGFTSGGDNLVPGGTDEMKAGRGLQVFAGGEYWVTQPLAVQMSVGLQYDRRSANGGKMSFQRFPLELMGLYAVTNNFRLGAGAQFVFSPRVRGTGEANGLGRGFNNATGRVLEAEFLVTPRTAVKLRHVAIDFTPHDDGAKVSGRHTGLMFSYYF